MVLLAETAVRPLGPAEANDLEDLLIVYLGDLHKNGQVWGEPLLTWIDGVLHAACHLPCIDSLADEHSSDFARGSLEKVRSAATADLTWTVRGESAVQRTTREAWAQCPSFFLRTHFLDRSSPLVAGDSGEPVPLYLLPIAPRLREGLLFWMQTFAALDRIWLNSDGLAESADAELSSFDSDLARSGRALLRDVEAAAQRPAYYYLMTYYVRHPPSVEDSCPSCHALWRVQPDTQTGRLGAFTFRCDRCRLVAEPGVDTSRVPESSD